MKMYYERMLSGKLSSNKKGVINITYKPIYGINITLILIYAFSLWKNIYLYNKKDNILGG